MPGFVNCKCFGESKVPRDETGVHEREGWAWVGWISARKESGVYEREGWAWVGWLGARDESGVHEREGWAWVLGCTQRQWSAREGRLGLGRLHAKTVECTRGKVGPG